MGAGGDRPSVALGGWLREQRRLRCWDVPQMARQLVRAAGDNRHTLPSKECLLVYIRRWERGDVGVSERYMLLYCEALAIAPGQFGPGCDDDGGSSQPSTSDGGQAGASGADEPGVVTGGVPPAVGGGASGPVGWPGMLRDIRDCLREDTKICQVRAEQAGADPVRAALCRGQALAYGAAAEQIDAALATGALLGQ